MSLEILPVSGHLRAFYDGRQQGRGAYFDPSNRDNGVPEVTIADKLQKYDGQSEDKAGAILKA